MKKIDKKIEEINSYMDKHFPPETIIEWLERLPDGYKQSAIIQCEESNKNKPCHSMSEAIYYFTLWEKTLESNLWSVTCNKIQKIEVNLTDKSKPIKYNLPPYPNEFLNKSNKSINKNLNV